MVDDRRSKLARVAARGGTPNERAIATRKLAEVPAARSEEADDVWTPMGVLIRDRRGAKAYLRGPALRHFLSHVKDGVPFTNRTVPLVDQFGSGDFYTILSWLVPAELCVKNGSRYTIPSRKLVREEWERQMILAAKL